MISSNGETYNTLKDFLTYNIQGFFNIHIHTQAFLNTHKNSLTHTTYKNSLTHNIQEFFIVSSIVLIIEYCIYVRQLSSYIFCYDHSMIIREINSYYIIYLFVVIIIHLQYYKLDTTIIGIELKFVD